MPADWIDTFMSITDRVPSPRPFRLWSAITCVSGALERRVWTEGSLDPIYPHIFTVLVGAPSSGKTNAIKMVQKLWGKLSPFHIAPDNVTREALVDALRRSLRTIMNGATLPSIFSALNVACPEFGVFFAHYDTAFLSLINSIYDSPSKHREERRTSDPIEVVKPHLVILAATQPDFLGSFMPETAWGMGFTSRLVLVYSPVPQRKEIFGKSVDLSAALASDLSAIHALHGEMTWTDAALGAFRAWGDTGYAPRPLHNRLEHYAGRRDLVTVKLAMISSASRGTSLRVALEDFERAREWLLEAERLMPDIFSAMSQRSDKQLLDDLQLELWRMYGTASRTGRKAIPDGEIWKYFKDRVPSERIPRLIEAAEKGGVMRRGRLPDEWIPCPLNERLSNGAAAADGHMPSTDAKAYAPSAKESSA